MLFLWSRPLLLLLIADVGVAVWLGLNGHEGHTDLDWLRALFVYAAAWWTIFFAVDLVDRWRTAIDVRIRLTTAVGEGFGFILCFFPTLVVLAAPVWFMVTGELAVSIIIGTVAMTASFFAPGPAIA